MCLVLCGHVLRKGFNGESGSSFFGGLELSLIIQTLGMLRPVGGVSLHTVCLSSLAD